MKIKTARNLALAIAATTLIGCAAETADDDEDVVPVVTSSRVTPAATAIRDPSPTEKPKPPPSLGGCSSWGCNTNHNPRRIRPRRA